MRFITEYANEKKRRILADDAYDEAEKKERLAAVSRVIRLYRNNFIPTDEAMREIANV